MSRVLLSGSGGTIGSAVVRRLLADPAYDVRVAGQRDAPQWMREACEIRSADLSDFKQTLSAMDGCSHVIHLATPAADGEVADFSLLADSAAIDSALLRAAVRHRVERFVYVADAAAIEPAEESASNFASRLGERLCQAAEAEHGLSCAICRTSAPTDVGDIVRALS